MEPIEFCRWLQGYFEIREASGKDKEQLSQAQINLIEEHLRLVFNKVTSQPSQLVSTDSRPLSYKDHLFPDRDPRQPPSLEDAIRELGKKEYHDGATLRPSYPLTTIYC